VNKVAKYINAEFPDAETIVEVGVGERDGVACTLVQEGYNVTVTDVRNHRELGIDEGLDFVRDDVTQPDSSVYQDSDLIYSLRPPYELHGAIEELSQEVGASLLIAPIGDETGSVGAELINHEGCPIFVSKR